MSEVKPILSVRGLKVHFKVKSDKAWAWEPRKILKAVDGVSFDLVQGETLGIVGESGCGKSTLARGILNLIPATAGEIVWQGQAMHQADAQQWLAVRKDIQMIFQDPLASLNPRMTIAQIIGEPLRIHRPELSPAQVLEKVRAVMARGSGDSSAQRACALGHRVRNTQPDGGLIGEGRSPISNWMILLRSILGSGIGMADSNASV